MDAEYYMSWIQLMGPAVIQTRSTRDGSAVLCIQTFHQAGPRKNHHPF